MKYQKYKGFLPEDLREKKLNKNKNDFKVLAAVLILVNMIALPLNLYNLFG